MKLEAVKRLKPGEEVIHRRYGASEVKEVQFAQGEFFGVIIHVKTDDGRKLLAGDCGYPIPDLLVDSPRSLKPSVGRVEPIGILDKNMC